MESLKNQDSISAKGAKFIQKEKIHICMLRQHLNNYFFLLLKSKGRWIFSKRFSSKCTCTLIYSRISLDILDQMLN